MKSKLRFILVILLLFSLFFSNLAIAQEEKQEGRKVAVIYVEVEEGDSRFAMDAAYAARNLERMGYDVIIVTNDPETVNECINELNEEDKREGEEGKQWNIEVRDGEFDDFCNTIKEQTENFTDDDELHMLIVGHGSVRGNKKRAKQLNEALPDKGRKVLNVFSCYSGAYIDVANRGKIFRKNIPLYENLNETEIHTSSGTDEWSGGESNQTSRWIRDMYDIDEMESGTPPEKRHKKEYRSYYYNEEKEKITYTYHPQDYVPQSQEKSTTEQWDPEWVETWTWDPEEGYPQTDVMNPPESGLTPQSNTNAIEEGPPQLT
jgi:hypothetical protein